MKYKIEVLDNGFVLEHQNGFKEAIISKDDVVNKMLAFARGSLDILDHAAVKTVDFFFEVKANPIEKRLD